MNTAQAAATVAALSDDPRLVRVARERLQSLAAGETMNSSPLRDAAVDPRPDDFCAPVNAGKPGLEGNPHAPFVRSAEVGSPIYERAVLEARLARGEGDA